MLNGDKNVRPTGLIPGRLWSASRKAPYHSAGRPALIRGLAIDRKQATNRGRSGRCIRMNKKRSKIIVSCIASVKGERFRIWQVKLNIQCCGLPRVQRANPE